MPRDVTYTFTATDSVGGVATLQVVVTVDEPALDLPTVPWEGGPAYWARFPRAAAAGWTEPTWFPICVFLGKPDDSTHVEALRDVGVDVYQGVEHNPPLSAATARGMHVLPHYSEWTAAEVGDDPLAVGHLVSDECEMGLSGCGDANDEFERLAVQRSYCDALRDRADGRFLQANFGNGVARTFWAPTTMDDHVALVDASSVDKYCYTSPDARQVVEASPDWPGGSARRAGAYGWLVDQMRSFQDPANLRPVWCFVETARPLLTESGATTITPDQLEGAVWAALRHEARGICYFQHNNDPTFGTYSLVDGPATLRDRVRTLNARVRELAPVLNSPSYVWDFGADVETMLKAHDDRIYVFAGVGLGQSPGTKTFTVPPGVTGTVVEALFEGRTVPVTAGRWTDAFAAEHSTHIYRIAV